MGKRTSSASLVIKTIILLVVSSLSNKSGKPSKLTNDPNKKEFSDEPFLFLKEEFISTMAKYVKKL